MDPAPQFAQVSLRQGIGKQHEEVSAAARSGFAYRKLENDHPFRAIPHSRRPGFDSFAVEPQFRRPGAQPQFDRFRAAEEDQRFAPHASGHNSREEQFQPERRAGMEHRRQCQPMQDQGRQQA